MQWIKVTINHREMMVGFDENSIHVYNAFPIKDELKVRGYRWDPARKSWWIEPADLEAELALLQNNLQSPAVPEAAASAGEISSLPRSYTVVELRNRIDRLIRDGIRGTIWIRGVVASDVKQYRWASYFDLRDEDEQVDIFFRVEVRESDLARINQRLRKTGVADRLEKDLPVFCQVEAHLSLRNVVDVRLTVKDILPEYTQSRIRNQRDVTVDRLKKEKIFANQKRLQLPRLIARIGLITSDQGTSARDILAGMGASRQRYHVLFADTRMEGAAAVESVLKAIQGFLDWRGPPLDAIVIARGGGSEQSLAVFNDYRICRAVCLAPLPVLAAIGHEKDVSALEMCAHLTPTPSTPSGMGRFFHDRFTQLQRELAAMAGRFLHIAMMANQRRQDSVRTLLVQLPRQAGQRLRGTGALLTALLRRFTQQASFTVQRQRSRIEDRLAAIAHHRRRLFRLRRSEISRSITRLDFHKRFRSNSEQQKQVMQTAVTLLRSAERRSDAEERSLTAMIRLAESNDPRRILQRGFTLALDENGRVIPTRKEFRRLRKAELTFRDGAVPIRERRKDE